MSEHAPLQQALLAWFDAHPRPLAWRDTKDPYAILVSEVMLQQTQAARVEPAWRAFLSRFPTPASLAAASPADVVTAWRGLGYNRRALNLHRAAKVIAERHGGVVPDGLAALRALPGVGEYTARAVLAFAYDAPAAPVDTNVSRVLARAVAGRPLGRAEAQALADGLVADGRARAWSSALMDLGARVCTARTPRCEACPLRDHCAWRRGQEQADPAAASAGRSRPQGRFPGSDRYHRGRLIDALRDGPVTAEAVRVAAGLDDPARAEALVAGLVTDGLAEWHEGTLRLPEV